ncbi:MAG: hypothetical protein WBE48_15295 [Xanthobacteraceae bacterium]
MAITSVAGNTQVATEMLSSAKNDGTNFKLLSTEMLTLSLCGRSNRRPETEHIDEGREHRRNRGRVADQEIARRSADDIADQARVPRPQVKREHDNGRAEERPFVPGKCPFAAPEAHHAEHQANERRDRHHPASRPRFLVKLDQIAGSGEYAENQP